MRVLVNALSVSNLSGRHVLMGHLSRMAQWTLGEHEYVVLFNENNRDIRRQLGGNVSWRECPGYTAHWLGRAAWETTCLPRVSAMVKSDFMFTPSGTIVPNLVLPQISFAQNPWALVKEVHKSAAQKFKAELQRHNYKSAVKNAAMMIFNSEYMREVYRCNAGVRERASEIVYQAIDDETHAAANAARNRVQREPLQILCVSAMAPHKGAETLVNALALLRERHRVPAQLVMAGPWPDAAYERKIVSLISRMGLVDAVEIKGRVSREELHNLYAKSRVFSLMSCCESFGIPAVEAQAFGTPVVSSNCCAIPEVCGSGGVFPEVSDAAGTADHLANLLTNQQVWEQFSAAAVANAEKYRWDKVSKKMLKMFDVISSRP